MKKLLLLLLLPACTPPETNQVYRSDGERIDLAYIVLAPFCTILCNTTVSTTGSRIEGQGSNTQSTSQTTSQSK